MKKKSMSVQKFQEQFQGTVGAQAPQTVSILDCYYFPRLNNSLDCCQEDIPETVECPKQKQEENKMDAIARQEQNHRDYLERRLGDVREDKLTEAGKVFYIDGDDQPKTWPELLDRISKGQFIYNQVGAEKLGED